MNNSSRHSTLRPTASDKTIRNLFVRLDKIGDLVLSLNVDSIDVFENERNHWLIAEGLEFIVNSCHPRRLFTAIDRRLSWPSAFRLHCFLRDHDIQRVFVFHAPWWVCALLWFHGIPERIGRLSQWHSFVFFNRGVRQSRSLADRHESQYNVDLVTNALELARHEMPEPVILKSTIDLTTLPPAKDLTFFPGEPVAASRYIVVHPGMAGSALNWPNHNYELLVQGLLSRTNVLITGTPSDRYYLQPLAQAFAQEPRVVIRQDLSGEELLHALAQSLGVVAPSTGVLHLAASLGVPCLGLYSPLQVERALRWGPRGPKAEWLDPQPWLKEPKTSAAADIDTANPMNLIPVAAVLERALRWLR